MKRNLIGHLSAGVSALALWLGVSPASAQDYKDASLPVETRVKDLLRRMTVEEKARQLEMYDGSKSLMDQASLYDHSHSKPDAQFVPERAEKAFGALGSGSIHDLY